MINIYLGSSSVGIQGPTTVQQWSGGLSGDQALGTLAGLLNQEVKRTRWYQRKQSVCIWLSGALARPFVLNPMPGLKTWTEAMAVAQSLAAEQTGLIAPTVVWLDAWKPQQVCMAVAADAQVLNKVHELTAEHGCKLCGLRPWWSAALSSAMAGERKPALLAVEEDGESLTLLAGEEGTWSLAKSISPMTTHATAVVQRAMFNTGVTADRVLKIKLRGVEPRPVEGDEPARVAGFDARWEWSA
jgi:hypothetical protein